MFIELILTVAMGYIPCEQFCSHHSYKVLILSMSDVDNFGMCPKFLGSLVLHAFEAHLGGFLMGILVGTVFLPVISVTKRHKSIMWGFRLAAIPLAVVLFVVSLGIVRAMAL